MIHGYYFDKTSDDQKLYKIEINTLNKITGFQYNSKNDILSYYDTITKRFELAKGIGKRAQILTIGNVTNYDNNAFGIITRIVDRYNYINSSNEIKFIYYCITQTNKLIKVSIVKSESTNGSVISVKEINIDILQTDDIELVCLYNDSTESLFSKDIPFVLLNKSKEKLYFSDEEGNDVKYIFTNTDESKINYSDIILTQSGKIYDKTYLSLYPICVRNYMEKDICFYFISADTNSIIRKQVFENQFSLIDNMNSVKMKCVDKYTFDFLGINKETKNLISHTFFLNEKYENRKLENKTSNYDKEIELYFDSGLETRSEDDKIKIIVRYYDNTFNNPNRGTILTKNYDSKIESVSVNSLMNMRQDVKVFKNSEKINELAKTDFKNQDIKIKTNIRTILSNILGSDEISKNLDFDIDDKDVDFLFEQFKDSKFIVSHTYDGGILKSLLFASKKNPNADNTIELVDNANMKNIAIDVENGINTDDTNVRGKEIINQFPKNNIQLNKNREIVFPFNKIQIDKVGKLETQAVSLDTLFCMIEDNVIITNRKQMSNEYIEHLIDVISIKNDTPRDKIYNVIESYLTNEIRSGKIYVDVEDIYNIISDYDSYRLKI